MDYLKAQGVDLTGLQVGGNACYTSRGVGEELLECIAEDIYKSNLKRVSAAPMFTLLIDESTDIAVSKHLVVYVRILDDKFQPQTLFLKNVTITDPKSDSEVLFNALSSALHNDDKECDIELKNCVGFGSDGAAVMLGNTKGVATRVKDCSPHAINIHCMAHRFNLATCQATKKIPDMKEFENVVADLYKYFGGSKSGNRKCELEHIAKVMDEKLVKLKECHEIRWIAMYEAVRAVFLSWKCLMAYFKDKKDQKSMSFYQAISDLNFIRILALLMDILPSLAVVTQQLQKRTLDISTVYPALNALKSTILMAKEGKSHYQTELENNLKKKTEKRKMKAKSGDKDNQVVEDVLVSMSYKDQQVKCKGDSELSFRKRVQKATDKFKEMRSLFCETLQQNMDGRFPEDTKDVATAFKVLAMRALYPNLTAEQFSKFGEAEMKTLLDFYGKERISKSGVKSAAMVDEASCLAEWQLAKEVVRDNMYARDSMKALWSMMYLFHPDSFPNLFKIASLALLMPYQTADCERGFSAQNAIKTSLRNCLNEDSLNALMAIKCEGGSLNDYDFTRALKIWSRNKDRRCLKKK